MEQKELICIGCPMGCRLHVTIQENGEMEVTGNTCPRGDAYARKELTDPTRIVTTSVKVEGGELSAVSVKTASDIPKDKIMECIRDLKNVVVKAPIAIGDIILEDAAQTGVPVVATRNVGKL